MTKPDAITDFRRSYILTAGPENSVRFVPESRCVIFNSSNALELEFIQCASCKAEHTFSDGELFMDNNYDFTPVFGKNLTSVIFSRYVTHQPKYKRVANMFAEPFLTWGKPGFHIHTAKSSDILPSVQDVIAATKRGDYLVVRTEFANLNNGLHAILEYPVKTINTNDDKEQIQVDTGPIVFPDIWKNHDNVIETLCLCYIAFNNLGKCEIIVESPTSMLEHTALSLGEDQNPEIHKYFLIDHYCDIRPLDASHTIYAL